MTEDHSKVLFLLQAVSGTTSLPNYQYSKYLCTHHDATLVIKDRSNIDSHILDKAERIYTPPGGIYIRSILYPLLTMAVYIKMYSHLKFVATSDQGESVFPALLLSIVQPLIGIPWIVFAWDVPYGISQRRESYLDELSLDSIYKDSMTKLTHIGYAASNLIILSDESNELRERFDKVEVIPGGADCEKIQSVSTGPSESDKPRIVYAGNMHYHRGIDILFEAVEMCDSEFTLVLIGRTPAEANIERQLPKPVEEMVASLTVNCNFLGFLESHEDVLKEVKQSDIGICLLPYGRGMSIWVENSYPIKLFEYMTAGIGVVASKTGQTKEILSDEQLVETNNPDELSKTIDNLLSNDEVLRNCKQSNLDNSKQYCWEHIHNVIDKTIDENGI